MPATLKCLYALLLIPLLLAHQNEEETATVSLQMTEFQATGNRVIVSLYAAAEESNDRPTKVYSFSSQDLHASNLVLRDVPFGEYQLAVKDVQTNPLQASLYDHTLDLQQLYKQQVKIHKEKVLISLQP